MARRILAATVALAILAQDAAFAAQAPSELAWDELAGVVVSKRISTVLPDGVRLQGEVLAVRPDSLVLDVQKSSNKKAYPRGQAEIPRASIRELRIIHEGNAAMRIVCGILGAIGGLAATGGIAVATDSLGAFVPCLLLLAPGSAVAGYYAGKLLDRRTTRIVVAPDGKTTQEGIGFRSDKPPALRNRSWFPRRGGVRGADDRFLSSAARQGRKSAACAGPGARGSDPRLAVFHGVARAVEALRGQPTRDDGLHYNCCRPAMANQGLRHGRIVPLYRSVEL